jgi:transglutaminase-like putative cysteine protease
LAVLFGFYYAGAAADDCEGRPPLRFYQSTVAGRVFLSAVFAALVATRQCEPRLLVLAFANAASAWAMHAALRRRVAGNGGAP